MEIKDDVKQFRDLQKSHKKVRGAVFCREIMLDLMLTDDQENKIQENSSGAYYGT